ncbi:NACHT domain-containing protein [Lysinibacillus xylanilyticus]|uniref:NACHT domain-containing protein n=1 Tax=Lysinibacillus xylanilyticus TaxID=582475 RepID=UPI0037F9DE92
MNIIEEKGVGIATELATSIVKSMGGFLKGKWEKSDFKSEQELIDSYEKYLIYSMDKYNKIKNLLYKRTPKPLYSFYENVDLLIGDQKIETHDINNLINLGKKFIITGTGGIGKSTMMKHLFLNCIERTDFVPILIELRNLNEKYNSENLKVDLTRDIYDAMISLKFEAEQQYFEYGLETGKNLIIFDGFDELKSEISKSVAEAIKTFSDRYSECIIIVASRPSDIFIAWNDFSEAEAQKLTKEQALSLVSKIDYFDEEIRNRFIDKLNESLYEEYEEFATIPLLLVIMLLTYEHNAEIPKNLNEFYEQAFSALFHTHDASKGGYKRDRETELSQTDFKKVFAHFCFKTYIDSIYSFNRDNILHYLKESRDKIGCEIEFTEDEFLEDLMNSVCMITLEGLDYIFSHRSFQEYFAAIHTEKLSDEVQEKLFKEKIFEDGNLKSNKYLEIVEEIQEERFMKNVIYPTAKEIKDCYLAKGIEAVFCKCIPSFFKISGMTSYTPLIKNYRYFYLLAVFVKFVVFIDRIVSLINYGKI